MNAYRTTSPRVRGRALTTAMVALVILGLGWAPKALAMPVVPAGGSGATHHLSAATLRREAAADRAQHLLAADR
jgi:hypothetical protein